MSIIQVYKSDTDGKLFEDKAKYVKHLRKVAASRLLSKREDKLESERESFLDKMGLVSSVDELKQFIKDNWKWFCHNGARRSSRPFDNSRAPLVFHEYIDVDIKGMYWSEQVRNTHSCPRNGVENFSYLDKHNKGKPTGYPGWTGRIYIKVRPPKYTSRGTEYMHDGFGSGYFERTSINTGSGGGGSRKDHKEYSYDIKLFAADFPVMHEKFRREQWVASENEKRQKMWNMLGGHHTTPTIVETPEDWVCPDPLIPQLVPAYAIGSNYPH